MLLYVSFYRLKNNIRNKDNTLNATITYNIRDGYVCERHCVEWKGDPAGSVHARKNL